MSNVNSTIYNCENPTGVGVIDRADIPKEKRDAIRALHRLEPKKNVRILYFAAIWILVGSIALNVDLFVVQVACSLVIGFMVVGFAVMMHDAVHGLLFRSSSLNCIIGFLCGLAFLLSFSAYRVNHLLHHVHERTEKDPDDVEFAAGKTIPLALMYYVALLFGAYLFGVRAAKIGLKNANRERRIKILKEYAAIIGFFLIVVLTLPSTVILKIWLIPFIIASHLISLRAVAEHSMATGGNPFTATRTVLSNKFVSFMMCNINYHLEHHLFPGVPWYNLPKIHQLLQDEYRKAGSSVYRSYTEFFTDFIKTTWSGIVPNVRMISKAIREQVCS